MPEVIEESGPVEYCEEDAEEEGLDDDEMDELAYEEDPLLNSDYEDDGKYGSQYPPPQLSLLPSKLGHI